MKESELREKAICGLCGLPIGHTGIPIFYRVKMESFGLSTNAIQRKTGLEMMLGGHSELARVMGPDEDMAVSMGPATKFSVCHSCYTEMSFPLMVFRDMADEE